MAISLLENLPNEIFEAINVFLDLRDLNNVRRSSRAMALKATQNHFGSFLRCRSVETTRPALEAMADLTTSGRIGCFVEEITLVGVVYNTVGLQHQLDTGAGGLVGRGDEGGGLLNEPTEVGTALELEHAAGMMAPPSVQSVPPQTGTLSPFQWGKPSQMWFFGERSI